MNAEEEGAACRFYVGESNRPGDEKQEQYAGDVKAEVYDVIAEGLVSTESIVESESGTDERPEHGPLRNRCECRRAEEEIADAAEIPDMPIVDDGVSVVIMKAVVKGVAVGDRHQPNRHQTDRYRSGARACVRAHLGFHPPHSSAGDGRHD